MSACSRAVAMAIAMASVMAKVLGIGLCLAEHAGHLEQPWSAGVRSGLYLSFGLGSVLGLGLS